MDMRRAVVLNMLALLFVFVINHGTMVDAQEYDAADLVTAAGRIVLPEGASFPKGAVMFFSSDNIDPHDYGTTLRSPKMIAFLEEGGKFKTLPFPSGSYFIGALDRVKWGVGGPPQPGETRYSAFDGDGEYLVVTLKKGEHKDLGEITVSRPPEFPERKDFFSVSGSVVDSQGKGVAGALVMAKKDYNEPRADYIAERTVEDGGYELKLPPGKYFFIARESMTVAGRPKPGGVMGVLGQKAPIGVGGKSDAPPAYIIGKSGQEYNNVDITMFEVPIPDVKRQEIESQVKSQKIDKESLPEKLPLMKVKPEETVRAPVEAREIAPANEK